ncbi:MAG: type VI secretion system baseplate subunit TssE [Holosporales bacterium]|jgi:type VI secretion system lysozyme-like protein|nr:type VI secretion system baseplate subunit TssE [Holosporales bacterium]
MRERGSVVAVAPLFDQLTDSSEQTKILLTFEALLDSIRKELTDIFETRASFSVEELDFLLKEKNLYGFPGVIGLPNFENSRQFERKCEQIIERFEPRLAEPVVTIEASNKDRLIISIQGKVIWAALREKVFFQIDL